MLATEPEPWPDEGVVEEVVIEATVESLGLRLHSPKPSGSELEYFSVEVGDPTAHASSRVYANGSGGLVLLCAEMAARWRGWQGEKSWSSCEGDFSLICTADGKGHVQIIVRLESMMFPRPWTFEGRVLVEAGQLDRLAAQMREFVEGARAAAV